MRVYIIVIASLSICTSALSQTAAVVVSHDDLDGVVDPGQTVRITIHITWTQGWTLGVFGGDAVASPDLGSAADPAHGFGPVIGGVHIQSGVAVAGSVRGFGVGVNPGSSIFPPTLFNGWAGTDALAYEWTAPDASFAGEYTFDFDFISTAPTVYLYPGAYPWHAAPVAASTTVSGTSLIVTPAPNSIGVLGVAMLLANAAGRRRSSRRARWPDHE